MRSSWAKNRFNRRFLTLANHYLFEPVTIRLVRDRIRKQDKGDRAFVDLLLMARGLGSTGLDALEVACDLTVQTGVVSAAIVLNEMRCLTEAVQPKALVDNPRIDTGTYARTRSRLQPLR